MKLTALNLLVTVPPAVEEKPEKEARVDLAATLEVGVGESLVVEREAAALSEDIDGCRVKEEKVAREVVTAEVVAAHPMLVPVL